jgi:hypothetical protein
MGFCTGQTTYLGSEYSSGARVMGINRFNKKLSVQSLSTNKIKIVNISDIEY